MINRIIAALLITTLGIYTASSYAATTVNDCQQADLSITAQSSCLDNVSKLVDRELQTWVNNHIFNLEEKALVTGRYSALKMFKRSQSNFITFRENDCRWRYLMISPEEGASVAYKQCYIQRTQTRISELSQIE